MRTAVASRLPRQRDRPGGGDQGGAQAAAPPVSGDRRGCDRGAGGRGGGDHGSQPKPAIRGWPDGRPARTAPAHVSRAVRLR